MHEYGTRSSRVDYTAWQHRHNLHWTHTKAEACCNVRASAMRAACRRANTCMLHRQAQCTWAQGCCSACPPAAPGRCCGPAPPQHPICIPCVRKPGPGTIGCIRPACGPAHMHTEAEVPITPLCSQQLPCVRSCASIKAEQPSAVLCSPPCLIGRSPARASTAAEPEAELLLLPTAWVGEASSCRRWLDPTCAHVQSDLLLPGRLNGQGGQPACSKRRRW